MNKNVIQTHIERREGGAQEHVYIDSEGHPTVGVGFNLDRRDGQEKIEALGLNYDDVRNGRQDLTPQQIDTLFQDSLNTAIAGAQRQVSNFDALPDGVQTAVVDMVFNMGEGKFAGFVKLVDALEHNDLTRAATEMKNSLWSRQVGERATIDIALVSIAATQAVSKHDGGAVSGNFGSAGDSGDGDDSGSSGDSNDGNDSGGGGGGGGGSGFDAPLDIELPMNEV